MTRRIFQSIFLVAMAVFLASVALIMGVLYTHYTGVQLAQLEMEAHLAAQGIEKLGAAYFEDLSAKESRVTWIAADGSVLYDNQSDPASMENHANREEFLQAQQDGSGASTRRSDTLTESSIYYALRLSDGTVLRLSMLRSTVLNLLLGIAQPICVVFTAALILSAVLAYRLSRRIVAPLNQLVLEDSGDLKVYPEVQPIVDKLQDQQKRLRTQAGDLRRKQQEFDAVTENMREGLVLLGRDDAVLSINPAALRFLTAAGIQVRQSLTPLRKLPEAEKVLRGAYGGSGAKATLHLQGRDYRLDANPVYSQEQITGVVLLITDVTEIEHAEQLRQEFTANVSHELKTPLQVICGCAELMTSGIARPEDMPKFAGDIYAESKRMIGLIEDIIRLSQLDEGAQGLVWEQVSLLELIRQTLLPLSPAADAAGISIELTGTEATMDGIRQLLAAIIHNLCENAIKYNRPGGRVTVKLEQSGPHALLTVADTGIGIPPESQERIFERFYRVDKSRSKAVGGTGLGLSIVKHAVRIHNGQISLESAPDMGTRITVRFPLRQK